jgi:hypothetical protein
MGGTWGYDGYRPHIRGPGFTGLWIHMFVLQPLYLGPSSDADTTVAILGTLATALSLSELASM